MTIKATLAVVSALLLVACGSNSSGTGGSAGTCAAPLAISACGTCSNQTGCVTCGSTLDQAGVSAYNALLDCIECTACYTTCGGSADSNCGSAPVITDACDVGTPGTTTCNTCEQCSTGSGATCGGELTACQAIPQCLDLVKNIYNTCHPLPM